MISYCMVYYNLKPVSLMTLYLSRCIYLSLRLAVRSQAIYNQITLRLCQARYIITDMEYSIEGREIAKTDVYIRHVV